MRALRWVGAWAALAAGLGGCGEAEAPRCGPASAVVAEVVDGDTVVLEGGARVRYLLVDAPESTGGRQDCFGAQARDFNRALVAGQPVALTYGEACTDRFGRLLAYVTVGGREVNRLLAERGYACTLYVAPAGGARRAEFEALEAGARQARRGLWGACAAVPCESRASPRRGGRSTRWRSGRPLHRVRCTGVDPGAAQRGGGEVPSILHDEAGTPV